MVRKVSSHKGQITQIEHSVSTKGTPYVTFCLQTNDALISCIAFEDRALGFKGATAGMFISIAGRIADDGKIVVDGYDIPALKSAGKQPARPIISRHPDAVHMIWLMDVLGARYVTKKLKEALGDKGFIVKVTGNLKQFDQDAYKKVLEELTREAREWADNYTNPKRT